MQSKLENKYHVHFISLYKFTSIETVCCDMSNWDQTKAAVEAIGPIDLLVNNAAYCEMTPFGSIGEKTIDK